MELSPRLTRFFLRPDCAAAMRQRPRSVQFQDPPPDRVANGNRLRRITLTVVFFKICSCERKPAHKKSIAAAYCGSAIPASSDAALCDQFEEVGIGSNGDTETVSL